MDVRIGKIGARGPCALALHRAGEVGRVLEIAAKTRGANSCAVAAREAAFGYLVPARVAEVAGEQLRQAGGVDTAAHVRRGPCEQGDPLGVVGPAGGPMRQVREYVPAPAGRGTGQVATIKLCQGQVKALRRAGTGPHGDAETRAGGPGALDHDQESLLAALVVDGVSYGRGVGRGPEPRAWPGRRAEPRSRPRAGQRHPPPRLGTRGGGHAKWWSGAGTLQP